MKYIKTRITTRFSFSNKINWKLTLIIFILAIGLIKSARAQPVSTFIEMAMQNNSGLQALDMEYEAALQIADQVDDYPDPKVNLGIGVLPVETRLGAQRLKLGVSQSIPWKGHLTAKKDLALASAETKAELSELHSIDIAYSIRKNYDLLIFLDRSMQIINDKLNVLDALEELAKSSVRSGKGKLSNVLFIERKREMLNADVNLLTQQKQLPIIIINRWSGRNFDENIVAVPDDQWLLKKDTLINYANQLHPQLTVLRQQVEASNQTVALTHFESKPKIGVGLDYSWIDARADADPTHNGRDVLMPMGSISIPLHKGRYTAKRQEEKIKQDAIHAKMNDLSEMYRAEIETAFAQIKYQEMRINKFENLKDITSETLKLMRTEYATEGSRFEELLRIEMELIDFDYEILKAEFETNLATSTLKKYN